MTNRGDLEAVMALIEWAQARGVSLSTVRHGACAVTLSAPVPTFKAPEATAEDLYQQYGGGVYQRLQADDHGLGDEEYQPVSTGTA